MRVGVAGGNISDESVKGPQVSLYAVGPTLQAVEELDGLLDDFGWRVVLFQLHRGLLSRWHCRRGR